MSKDLLKGPKWILDHLQAKEDFPFEGITFQWYGRLLRDPEAFHHVIQDLVDRYREMPLDGVAALDARGFIFGTALAYELHLPLSLVRKQGKIPGDILSVAYDMEYGSKTVEIEKESIEAGQKILIVDDVLATGGTTRAACHLIEQLHGQVVEVCCLIELLDLHGREKLSDYSVHTLVTVKEP